MLLHEDPEPARLYMSMSVTMIKIEVSKMKVTSSKDKWAEITRIKK